MLKSLVVVLLIAATTSAGCKDKPAEAAVQCRVITVDPAERIEAEGKWGDCKVKEDTAEFIYETFDHPGLIIFTEEQTEIGKNKWSEPKRHSENLIIPLGDFSENRNET
jgi:hypothetical protein